MKKKKAVYNAVTGFVTQIIMIALGILVPRIILVNYGSDTNGLTSTVTQIFTYMALLEAGIGQATRNALYEPAARKDRQEICGILSVSRAYYWKITRYYALGVLALAFLLPLLLKTSVGYWVIFWLVLFEGMSGVLRFLFVENWMQLLAAEGKQYVQANISLVNRVLTYAVKITLACFRVNIAVIQLGFFLVSLIQLLLYRGYMRKHYGWLKYQVRENSSRKLEDRNAFVLTEIAWTVFSSTDMILLSAMFSTSLSSVYAVYQLVYSNLTLLLNAVYTGVLYLPGQAFHESRKRYEEIHDSFETIFMGAVGFLMSVCSVMMLSFVALYTRGVSDINYIYRGLPLMFGLVQIFSWDRFVSGNLTGVAGYAKKISRISVAEAGLNLTLSVILAFRFGIYGILGATVAALLLKLSYLTYFSNVVIMKRSVWQSLKTILVDLAVYLGISAAAWCLPVKADSVGVFLLWGLAASVLTALLYVAANVVFNRRGTALVMDMIKKKK